MIRTLFPRIRVRLLVVETGTAMAAAGAVVWAVDNDSDTGSGTVLKGFAHVPFHGPQSRLERSLTVHGWRRTGLCLVADYQEGGYTEPLQTFASDSHSSSVLSLCSRRMYRGRYGG